MTSTQALDPTIPDDVWKLAGAALGSPDFSRDTIRTRIANAIMADRSRRAALPTEASEPAVESIDRHAYRVAHLPYPDAKTGPTEASEPVDMREQFWVAPTLLFQRGPREWHDDIDEACERAAQYSRATGHNYEVYQRVAFVTPTTLKLIKAEHRP